MNPPEDLLQSALRSPEGSAALILADWYEEQGNLPASELIRCLVEHERLAQADASRPEIASDSGPHPALDDSRLAVADLAARVRLKIVQTQQLRGADALVAGNAQVPLAHLRDYLHGIPAYLEITDPRMFALALSQWLRDWPARILRAGPLRPSQLRGILRSPGAELLVGLSFTAQDTASETGLEVLGKFAQTVRLSRLGIHTRNWLDGHTDRLRQVTQATPLVELHLGTSEGLLPNPARLGNHGWGRELRTLRLRSAGGFTREQSPGSALDAATIANWGNPEDFPALESLHMQELTYNPDAIEGFAKPGHFPHLRRLILGAGNNRSIDWRPLGRLLSQGNLRSLELLAGYEWAPNALEAILSTTTADCRLQAIGLKSLTRGDRSLQALAAWPGLARIVDLDFGERATASEADWLALVQSPDFQPSRLNFSGADLPESVCLALGTALQSGQLTEFGWHENVSFSRARWTMWLHSGMLKQLRRLELRFPRGADATLAWVGRHADCPQLQEVVLASDAMDFSRLDVWLSDRFPKLWRITFAGSRANWPLPRRWLGRWQVTNAMEIIHPERMP
ncbi:hypothetical protein [Tuwongella immobilis]|uniref:Repeat-companion domain protein n=1 Tax=Tuwongella immobilis TaxID=692036 RepID=A0A6C2YVF9_9BACT|nr:hypothetical protein [Tuwongella immobilis]VIP04969.1 unnamed protein product [Tuwongella immobilis]VTS07296.1 unnamed protein product [Tuwongella immobilis]